MIICISVSLWITALRSAHDAPFHSVHCTWLDKSKSIFLIGAFLLRLVQRYLSFVHHLLEHPTGGSSLANVAIPNGLNIVMNEVITTVSFFLRLITYNKMVFNEHYDRLISQLQSSTNQWDGLRISSFFRSLFHMTKQASNSVILSLLYQLL